MSIKNDDVHKLIKDRMTEMENHFNNMESILSKSRNDNADVAGISLSLGKLTKIYQELAFYLGVFDDNPKYKN